MLLDWVHLQGPEVSSVILSAYSLSDILLYRAHKPLVFKVKFFPRRWIASNKGLDQRWHCYGLVNTDSISSTYLSDVFRRVFIWQNEIRFSFMESRFFYWDCVSLQLYLGQYCWGEDTIDLKTGWSCLGKQCSDIGPKAWLHSWPLILILKNTLSLWCLGLESAASD